MHISVYLYPVLLPPLALRDNRIQLHRSTSTELSITIAEVQLADEGEYTCSIFTMPVRTARATVTVLGGLHKHAYTQYIFTQWGGVAGPVSLTLPKTEIASIPDL